jgi:hypothetical protein
MRYQFRSFVSYGFRLFKHLALILSFTNIFLGLLIGFGWYYLKNNPILPKEDVLVSVDLEFFNRLYARVFNVYGNPGQARGFVTADKSYIFTNYHVLDRV